MRNSFSLGLFATSLICSALAFEGCVAPAGQGALESQVCASAVGAAPADSYIEDLTSGNVLYYPKDGTANPGYCPKPAQAPAGTSYKLVSAQMNYVWVGGTTVDVTSQVTALNATDCTSGLVLETVGGSGGIGPVFVVPAPEIADDLDFPGNTSSLDGTGANSYGMVDLQLNFNVTLPADVDPAQTEFSYSIDLIPVYDAVHDIYTGYSLPTGGVPPLTPSPGDCQVDFPPTAAPTQETIAVSQSLTTSNAACGGTAALQAWPATAQLQVTGSAIVTMGSQQIQVADVLSASPIAVSATGAFSLSVTLANPGTIVTPSQVTDLVIPAQIQGVSGLSGQSILLDVGAPSLSVTYGVDSQGNVDQSQIIAAFTFSPLNAASVPMAASAAQLCPGAPCLDGSTVVQCNMSYCAYSLGSGGASSGASSGALAAAQAPPKQPVGKASCGSNGSYGGGSCGGGPSLSYTQPVCGSQCPSGSLCTTNNAPQPNYNGVSSWIY